MIQMSSVVKDNYQEDSIRRSAGSCPSPGPRTCRRCSQAGIRSVHIWMAWSFQLRRRSCRSRPSSGSSRGRWSQPCRKHGPDEDEQQRLISH